MTAPIALWRINLLRVAYAILVFGLGSVIWPGILDRSTTWSLHGGTVTAMLGALSLLAVLGLRHPLSMLPLLLFEIGWKAIWLLRMVWPQWAAHTLDAASSSQLWECLPIIPYMLLVPWDHVVRVYLMQPGAPWRATPPATPRTG